MKPCSNILKCDALARIEHQESSYVPSSDNVPDVLAGVQGRLCMLKAGVC